MSDLIDRATVQSEMRAYLVHESSEIALNVEQIIAALPARGVGVKPLDWQLCAGQDGVYYHAFDPLYGRDVEAPNEATCDAIDQNRTARILAALEPALAPTDAAHVNETPKSEHDAGNVLTDAAQAREAALAEKVAEICDGLAVGYAAHKGAGMALADAKREILAILDLIGEARA